MYLSLLSLSLRCSTLSLAQRLTATTHQDEETDNSSSSDDEPISRRKKGKGSKKTAKVSFSLYLALL
jgi:hypothetical protein